MKPQNVLGMVVAYYLSKFDPVSYSNLGYKTRNGAHQDIGVLMDINPNTVKNMRDEFDSVNDNSRVGWYQSPLRPSRKKVIEMFQEMTESELREVVLEILYGQTIDSETGLQEILASFTHMDKKTTHGTKQFILRGPTGRKAEEYFIHFHSTKGKPYPGNLVDTRDQGCGYDFRLETPDQSFMIEVKGLEAVKGGIAFTAKEWQMACENGSHYFLVIVSGIGNSPVVKIVRNPALHLQPVKSIYTTVQIRWHVSHASLTKIYSED